MTVPGSTFFPPGPFFGRSPEKFAICGYSTWHEMCYSDRDLNMREQE